MDELAKRLIDAASDGERQLIIKEYMAEIESMVEAERKLKIEVLFTKITTAVQELVDEADYKGNFKLEIKKGVVAVYVRKPRTRKSVPSEADDTES